MSNNRKSAGNPDGGQWTEKSQSDSGLELDDDVLDELAYNDYEGGDDYLYDAPVQTLKVGETTIYKGYFPYETQSFDTYEEAKAAGFADEQIWSVVEGDEEADEDAGEMRNSFIYGPPHHYVNVINFVATEERHDFNTYWEEEFSMDYAFRSEEFSDDLDYGY